MWLGSGVRGSGGHVPPQTLLPAGALAARRFGAYNGCYTVCKYFRVGGDADHAAEYLRSHTVIEAAWKHETYLESRAGTISSAIVEFKEKRANQCGG